MNSQAPIIVKNRYLFVLTVVKKSAVFEGGQGSEATNFDISHGKYTFTPLFTAFWRIRPSRNRVNIEKLKRYEGAESRA